MFTYELARRLQGSGVTANALHPGVVRTNFGREDSKGWMRLMLPVIRPFLKSPERGAATSLYLASSPDVEGVSGRYFANSKPKTSSKASQDTTAAARLWDVSAALVGLPSSGHL
jgi:NAD(P)-dependent dehydrogenase (short-subunit alcohol dehydrogenase family)